MDIKDLKEGDFCLFECYNKSTFIAQVVIITSPDINIFFKVISAEEESKDILKRKRIYDTWPYKPISSTHLYYRASLYKKENPDIEWYVHYKDERPYVRDRILNLIKIF